MTNTSDTITPRRAAVALTYFATLLACGDPAAGDTRFHSVDNRATNFDTDWTGEGGAVEETFAWENPAAAAEFSMDITAGGKASVDVVLADADGKQVAAFSLGAGSADDSLDGLSQAGAPGTWTIAVAVSDFRGDGSLNVTSAEPDD